MLNPSVTNPSISDVYQQIKRKELILQPSFQRKFVWTYNHQEAFIETILKGLPFPEIYVCQGETNINNLTTTRDVIDGQQRLTTIFDYINNDYYDSNGTYKFPFKNIPSFPDLSDDQKKAFIQYKVVFRDLGDITYIQTREIFKRINMTEFKLDDIEIQNAIYDGEFIQTAKDILDQFNLKEYGVLKESEFTRMADLHYILLIMSTLEHNGYFPNNNGLEEKVAEYNEAYPNSQKMKDALLETFSIIKKLDFNFDSLWFRKSSFFTLIVEITKILLNEKQDSKLYQFIYNSKFKENLIQFSKNVLDNRETPSSEFYQYYWNTYQGTNNRSARVIRSEFFIKHCLNY